MADYKCNACGASFPSEDALKSHAKMKMTEESPHYAKMSAMSEMPMYPGPTNEKPR